MKSSLESKLLQEVLKSLGFKSFTFGRDYWLIGPLALGMAIKDLKPPFEVGLIIAGADFDGEKFLERQKLVSTPYYWELSGQKGLSFRFKEFNFNLLTASGEALDIPELRLHQAFLTLLELHGSELRQVIKRYLNYGLSLERAFGDYFGWEADWKQRLSRLPDPSSREALLRALS